MKNTLIATPCDVVMPSISDEVSALVRANLPSVIIVLTVMLIAATVITVVLVHRRKHKGETDLGAVFNREENDQ